MASRLLWDDKPTINRQGHTRAIGRAIVGKPIRHIDVPEATFREGMQAAGLPSPLIEMQIEYCAAVKEGRAGIVTNEIEQLLGRPPRGYAAWAHEHARAFL